MSIKKTLGLVGIVLSVAVTVAIGKATPVQSVKIGDLTWTKQNINIETKDSWCYENNKSNCDKYGRLYTWEAAKSACAGMGDKWRLPTGKDWDNLVGYAGQKSVVGKKLKSAAGWNDKNGKSGNGIDEYGFSALPGGSRSSDGSFVNVGDNGSWWSAREVGGGTAYYRIMYGANGNVFDYYDDKQNGFSVRCVQD